MIYLRGMGSTSQEYFNSAIASGQLQWMPDGRIFYRMQSAINQGSYNADGTPACSSNQDGQYVCDDNSCWTQGETFTCRPLWVALGAEHQGVNFMLPNPPLPAGYQPEVGGGNATGLSEIVTFNGEAGFAFYPSQISVAPAPAAPNPSMWVNFRDGPMPIMLAIVGGVVASAFAPAADASAGAGAATVGETGAETSSAFADVSEAGVTDYASVAPEAASADTLSVSGGVTDLGSITDAGGATDADFLAAPDASAISSTVTVEPGEFVVDDVPTVSGDAAGVPPSVTGSGAAATVGKFVTTYGGTIYKYAAALLNGKPAAIPQRVIAASRSGNATQTTVQAAAPASKAFDWKSAVPIVGVVAAIASALKS